VRILHGYHISRSLAGAAAAYFCEIAGPGLLVVEPEDGGPRRGPRP
jgi:hypothetical protein